MKYETLGTQFVHLERWYGEGVGLVKESGRFFGHHVSIELQNIGLK